MYLCCFIFFLILRGASGNNVNDILLHWVDLFYSLDIKYPPKLYVLKIWFLEGPSWEILEPLRYDAYLAWIFRSKKLVFEWEYGTLVSSWFFLFLPGHWVRICSTVHSHHDVLTALPQDKNNEANGSQTETSKTKSPK